MKLGILTFHRALNYGAVLQCFALKHILEEYGCQVYVIDYKQKFIEQLSNYSISFRGIAYDFLFRPSLVLNELKIIMSESVRMFNFFYFRTRYLDCKEIVDDDLFKGLDVIVIGSDQVWNLDCTGGVDNLFLGNFVKPENKRIFGYSISSNIKSIQYLKDDIKKIVGNFDDISFREKNVNDEIKKILGIQYSVTLDPTLLLGASEWQSLINNSWSERNYVVVYQVRGSKEVNTKINRFASDYAKKNKCHVINLSNGRYSVRDFVSIIKYAKLVFTSSFHAIVFSIIFEREIAPFKLNDGSDDRYVNLLNALNLDYIIHNIDDQFLSIHTIDYRKVKNKLERMKVESLNYLMKITNA